MGGMGEAKETLGAIAGHVQRCVRELPEAAAGGQRRASTIRQRPRRAREGATEAATEAEAARRTLAATTRELDEAIKRREIWVQRREKRQAEQKYAEESRSTNQDRLNLAETMLKKRRAESDEANLNAEQAVAARQEAENNREVPTLMRPTIWVKKLLRM